MEYCLYSFDPVEIKKAKDNFPVNCYASNPTKIFEDLSTTKISFLENAKVIRKTIGEDPSLFIQVIGLTSDEMVEDGKKIKKEVSGNTYVKIPASKEGFRAIRVLKELDIKISCTAVFTLNQAMLAAEAGADYVAVYVSRLNNLGVSGIELVRNIKEAFKDRNIQCKVAAASLKTPLDVEESIKAGANNVTIPYSLLEKMSKHTLTKKTMEDFKNDWENLFGEGIKIYNMNLSK